MNRMKILLGFFTLFLSYSTIKAQGEKVITGRVLNEDLEILPNAKIYNMDTTVLGSTNLEGFFSIHVTTEPNELLLGAIGMEWIPIKVEGGCQYLEIIVMVEMIYDFMSSKRIKRQRYKRFKKLPEKHLEAYNMGIFKSKSPCVCYVFKE